eukprot:COSAG02_NODE_12689_length_1509_cov_1.573759_2_plen_115_part_00
MVPQGLTSELSVRPLELVHMARLSPPDRRTTLGPNDDAEYYTLNYGGRPKRWPDGTIEIVPTNDTWAAYQYHVASLGGFATVFRRENSLDAEFTLALRGVGTGAQQQTTLLRAA